MVAFHFWLPSKTHQNLADKTHVVQLAFDPLGSPMVTFGAHLRLSNRGFRPVDVLMN